MLTNERLSCSCRPAHSIMENEGRAIDRHCSASIGLYSHAQTSIRFVEIACQIVALPDFGRGGLRRQRGIGDPNVAFINRCEKQGKVT